MRKSLLFIAMFAFIASSFAQKEVDKSLKAFQLNSNHTINTEKAQIPEKGVNANLNESFDIFIPASWSADPATGMWEGSATWQYSQYNSNWGDGVFAVMDCFDIAADGEGSLITPVLHPVAGNNTLSYDVIEMLLSDQYITATGMRLFVEFSTDGVSWTTSTTNVLEQVTDHNTANAPQTATTLTEDLSAYNDGDVQVRFRCISDYGGFSLFLDNVTGPDATIDLLTNELALNHSYLDVIGFDYYSVIAIPQFSNVQIKGSVSNIGSADQTGVEFYADDYDNAIFETSTAQDIASGETDTLVVDITAPTTTTSYVFETSIEQVETDENPDNNVGDTVRFSADPTYYFRATNLTSILTSYSFGASAPAVTGMEYGANYHIAADATIDSISILIYGAVGTGTVVGKLYSVDVTTGDRTLIVETAPYTPTGSPEYKNIVFPTSIDVTAGQILTATAQLNIDVAANDTISIGADGTFPGDASVAGAAYLQVGGTFGWYTVTGTVPVVGLVFHDVASEVSSVTTTSEINIYPNPTTGLLNVINAENATINVYNTVGELVKTVTNTNTVDLSDVQNGTYIVKVITNDNIVVKNIVLTK